MCTEQPVIQVALVGGLILPEPLRFIHLAVRSPKSPEQKEVRGEGPEWPLSSATGMQPTARFKGADFSCEFGIQADACGLLQI